MRIFLDRLRSLFTEWYTDAKIRDYGKGTVKPRYR